MYLIISKCLRRIDGDCLKQMVADGHYGNNQNGTHRDGKEPRWNVNVISKIAQPKVHHVPHEGPGQNGGDNYQW